MKTSLWAIGLVVLATFFLAIGNVSMKIGAQRLPELLTNWQVLLALSLYGIATLLLIYAFKGGNVTTLYSIVATAYFWVTLLSIYVFDETVSLTQWAGIATVMVGVFLATREKDLTRY